ncbi:MAG: hypothetical protein PUG60_13215 [Lachnospiraceae bacterium]|nr:hypothetical protein [Lachnospiraceae bacterium]MDY4970112.1 hypothetical protein [Lachnospiraceae bacterium]
MGKIELFHGSDHMIAKPDLKMQNLLIKIYIILNLLRAIPMPEKHTGMKSAGAVLIKMISSF